MKLIKPSFLIKEQESGLLGIYRQIEYAGRICYKSSDKITEDSAKFFVDRMIASGHEAMLEHGTVYLRTYSNYDYDREVYERYKSNPYSRVEVIGSIEGTNDTLDGYYITTNYRVLVENNWLDDLKYLCEPTEHHAKRITVHFVCDRGVSHEFVRHRVFSFAQESTRYCNYSKNKFGNELTFIIPCWSKAIEGNYGTLREPLEIQFKEYDEDVFEMEFINELINIEFRYMNILNASYTPQQARAVVPNALKTELVMTGFIDDWWGEYLVIDKATGLIDQRIHGKFYDELNNIDRDKYRVVEKGFFPLRCSNGAHPQAQELAIPLRQEFINKKIW